MPRALFHKKLGREIPWPGESAAQVLAESGWEPAPNPEEPEEGYEPEPVEYAPVTKVAPDKPKAAARKRSKSDEDTDS
jgi:hypothetical protein